MAPLCGPSMRKRPSRVRRITSPADMPAIMASHWSRRACSQGSTAWMWSSMNSMVTRMMSPCSMSSRQRSSAPGSWPHSAAVCRHKVRPGRSRRRVMAARSTAPARWLSSVMTTMRTAHVSAGVVRFGIVEGLDGDQRHTLHFGKALGVAARLAADEERDLRAAPSRPRAPSRRDRPARGPGTWHPDARVLPRRGTRSPRGTCPADAPPGPSSADGPRCRRGRWPPRSPSAASSGRGSPGHGPGPRSRHRGCPAAWRCAAPSACRARARAGGPPPGPRPRDSRR